MLNKPKLMSALFLTLGISHAHALDCAPMAKIHWVDKMDHVLILRGGTTEEWASRQNRELCAGDKIIVPKVIPHLKVTSYSYPPQSVSLQAGESYQVERLSECNAWCKAKHQIKLLRDKLTQEEPVQPVSESVGTKGYDKDVPIFMSLAAAQGAESPFYLFSRDGAIPLFWNGRQSPYRIEVTNAQGDTVVQQTVEKANTVALTLPDTELNQRYTLRISEEGSDEVYQKPLVFTVPPFSLEPNADKFELFAALLAISCGEHAPNWRLEIWRQLHGVPDSQEKERFMGHLAGDDFDIEEVGLCESS